MADAVSAGYKEDDNDDGDASLGADESDPEEPTVGAHGERSSPSNIPRRASASGARSPSPLRVGSAALSPPLTAGGTTDLGECGRAESTSSVGMRGHTGTLARMELASRPPMPAQVATRAAGGQPAATAEAVRTLGPLVSHHTVIEVPIALA